MSTFSRLFGLATKALDKTSSGRPSASGSGDWRSVVTSAADALGGAGRDAAPAPAPASSTPAHARDRRPGLTPPPPGAGGGPGSAEDRAAIARYDYLLRTAAPEQVEEIHREAFARLTPAQRTQVQERMRAELTPGERPRSSSPFDLARAAARTEAREPGRMRGLLSRAGRGAAVAGVGGAALGVLGVVAGGAVLSGVGGSLLEQAGAVDFEALASGVDLGGIAAEAEGVVGQAGEQVSGWGEQIADLGIPGLGDLFGR